MSGADSSIAMAEEEARAPDSLEAATRSTRHRAQSQSLSPTELTLFLYVLPRDPGAFVRACVCVGVCGRR